MRKIERKIFYDNYRLQFGRLTQTLVDRLNFLLDKLESSAFNEHECAYILATIMHETGYKDNMFAPITEIGSQAYLKGKRYYPYIGRGFVQITWYENYLKFTKLLNIDLVNHPEYANEPEAAWKILEIGMTKGLFTGRKLQDYFNSAAIAKYSTYKLFTGYRNALGYLVTPRRIINGTDVYNVIGSYAEKIFKGIYFASSDYAQGAYITGEV